MLQTKINSLLIAVLINISFVIIFLFLIYSFLNSLIFFTFFIFLFFWLLHVIIKTKKIVKPSNQNKSIYMNKYTYA